MKTKHTSDPATAQIVEYLAGVSSHNGYHWDGLDIEPGTAVASFKTIAAETGLSYYRVKKRLAALAEAGTITITRHKCFAVITVNASPTPQNTKTETTAKRTVADGSAGLHAYRPDTSVTEISAATSHEPTPMALNRAQRRRIAREAAKMDRRMARKTAVAPAGRRNFAQATPPMPGNS